MKTTRKRPKLPKRQQELLDFLGPKYSVKRIDLGDAIYRKINDNYDIEINVSGRYGASIFVWDISRGMDITARIVERHFDVEDQNEVKELLDGIVKKYGGDGE